MRKQLIAGNWKMNKGEPEAAVALAKELVQAVGDYDKVDILLCPPATALAAVAPITKESNLALGAQNVYPEEKGAYTGELSPLFLKAVGCDYCIVGHSERRKYFAESNQFINKKVSFLLAHNLKPIMCIGETLEQRQAEQTEAVVKTQLLEGLENINAEQVLNVTIAYEPVWAIGTGLAATKEQAQEVHSFLRKLLADKYSQEIADKIVIQYGGSVNSENAEELLSQPDIDGALVGGASLVAEKFIAIIKAHKK